MTKICAMYEFREVDNIIECMYPVLLAFAIIGTTLVVTTSTFRICVDHLLLWRRNESLPNFLLWFLQLMHPKCSLSVTDIKL